MSDEQQQPQTPAKKTLATRVADFAEGATFFIFIVVLLLQNGPALVFGVAWILLNLGLLIFWPGQFTFAVARTPRPDEDHSVRDREPRTLSVPGLMALSLGVPGVIDLFRVGEAITLLVALGLAAAIGSIFFALVHVLDPPIRTAPQMALLGAESLLWSLGLLTGIGLLFYA